NLGFQTASDCRGEADNIAVKLRRRIVCGYLWPTLGWFAKSDPALTQHPGISDVPGQGDGQPAATQDGPCQEQADLLQESPGHSGRRRIEVREQIRMRGNEPQVGGVLWETLVGKIGNAPIKFEPPAILGVNRGAGERGQERNLRNDVSLAGSIEKKLECGANILFFLFRKTNNRGSRCLYRSLAAPQHSLPRPLDIELLTDQLLNAAGPALDAEEHGDATGLLHPIEQFLVHAIRPGGTR